jgi:hypothetical protein
METGAIVAVTTPGGGAADTATVKETVMEAAIVVAGLIAEQHPKASMKCMLTESKKWWQTKGITRDCWQMICRVRPPYIEVELGNRIAISLISELQG